MIPERRIYTRQFKDEAIALVLQQGYTCQKAGEQLGVPPKTLANWVRPLRKQERSCSRSRSVAETMIRRRCGHGLPSWRNNCAHGDGAGRF